MSRGAVAVAASMVLSCSTPMSPAVTEHTTDDVGAPRVGAPVFVDAYALPSCELTAVAFVDVIHGYVRDNCHQVFVTADSGQSFALLSAPLPPLGWVDFPRNLRIDRDVSVAIDGDRRGLAVISARGTRRIALRSSGHTVERIRGIAASAFGRIAWTAHVVLGSDGEGPLIARYRLADGEIAQAVQPFEREWLVRTRDGRVLRSRKLGRLEHGEDPRTLVAGDDFDRWLYEAATSERDASPPAVEEVVNGEAMLKVSLWRASDADTHAPVTFTLERYGGYWVSGVDGHRVIVSDELSAPVVAKLRSVWRVSAVPDEWSTAEQPLYVEIRTRYGKTFSGRYAFPSPLAIALVSPFTP